MNHYIEKPSIIRKWFSDKGYTGTYYDVQFAYFQTLTTLTKGTLYDHVLDRMRQLGFAGTMRDCLDAFFIEKMGVSDPKLAERLFWRDSSLEFELVAPVLNNVTDDDGNLVKDDDGNQVTG